MKQFFEFYAGLQKLATLLRELSWSKHLLLLSQCKTPEEKEFHLLAATRGRWSHRELDRQIFLTPTWKRTTGRTAAEPPSVSSGTLVKASPS